jgi:ketosteroid isomerase-like protein
LWYEGNRHSEKERCDGTVGNRDRAAEGGLQNLARQQGREHRNLVGLLADVVDFRSLADGRLGMPWTKTRRSPSEVREYLHGLTSTFEMEHYTIERTVCQDDTIVVICSTGWKSKATGKRFDTPKVDVWRVKDGKMIAFFEYYDTAAVAEAAAE